MLLHGVRQRSTRERREGGVARLVRVGVGDNTVGLLGDLLVFQAEVAGLLGQATAKKKWKVLSVCSSGTIQSAMKSTKVQTLGASS